MGPPITALVAVSAGAAAAGMDGMPGICGGRENMCGWLGGGQQGDIFAVGGRAKQW